MVKQQLIATSIALALTCGSASAVAQQHPAEHGKPAERTAAPAPTPATPQQPHNDQAHQPEPSDKHEMPMTGVLGIPKARSASGTAWLPDLSPMYAVHRQFGDWGTMLHGNVFMQYINEASERGDDQLGSVNWLMGMAERRVRRGELSFRTMFSLEPFTVGKCGYPDLLATGEFCRGEPLHDRQHPHDLIMEAAAHYQTELTRRVGLELYTALAGEPALGPVAFPHRISSLSTPIAPLTHHWLDSTHISYGVLSAGVFGRRWKAEASLFNGREPDDDRFDLDLDRPDSVAARVWLVPTDQWALQVSRGHLNEAEVPPFGGPRRDVTRTTASATHHFAAGATRLVATTAAWGRNTEEDHSTDAFLIESDLQLDGRNTVFGRLEFAEKTGEDLVIPALGEEAVTVSKLQVGYMRRLRLNALLEPTIGGSLSFGGIPNVIEDAYDRESGFGIAVFLSVRPVPMKHWLPNMGQ